MKTRLKITSILAVAALSLGVLMGEEKKDKGGNEGKGPGKGKGGDSMVKTIFDAIDKDGNGAITPKELGESRRFKDASKKEVGEAFKAKDANGDGKISGPEFAKSFKGGKGGKGKGKGRKGKGQGKGGKGKGEE